MKKMYVKKLMKGKLVNKNKGHHTTNSTSYTHNPYKYLVS